MNLDELKSALTKAGFQVATEEETAEFIAYMNARHNSPEARNEQALRDAWLSYQAGRVKYKFTPAMGEISGFGGGYEATCRLMLDAGLRWLDDHPDASPGISETQGVYGIVKEDNQDAKDLSAAVVAASGGDCTGAMHHAVMSHCMFIRKNGWPKYVEEMSKKEHPDASGT